MFLPAMTQESQAEHFRQMAMKCWQLAGSTDDPRAVETLCKLAEEYEQAAEAAATGEAILSPHAARQRGPAPDH